MLVSGPLNQRSHFVPTRSANRWDREFQESGRPHPSLPDGWGQYLEVRAVCAITWQGHVIPRRARLRLLLLFCRPYTASAGPIPHPGVTVYPSEGF